MDIFIKNSIKFKLAIDTDLASLNKFIKSSGGITDSVVVKRIDWCILIIDNIIKAQQYYIKMRDKNRHILTEVIQFDYDISSYAERLYMATDKLLHEVSKPVFKKSKHYKEYGIQSDVYRELNKLNLNMLYMSARWKIERLMNIFDLDKTDKKKKYPKREPLLQAVTFTFNRILSTKMGVQFEDGFQPNKAVVCLPPSSAKTYSANAYSVLMLGHHVIYFKETGIIRMTNNATNAQAYGRQTVSMMKGNISFYNHGLFYPYQVPFLEIFPEIKEMCPKKSSVDEYNTSKLFNNDSSDKILMSNCSPECTDSLFMFGRDSGINGKRALLGAVSDDLSDGKDTADNDDLHKQITGKLQTDVADRSDDDDCPFIMMGTMYNENDYLNVTIDKWEEQGLVQHPKYKHLMYTKDGKNAIVLVDIVGDDGKSIAPLLYSEEKLRERENDLRKLGQHHIFMLLYRQKRTSRNPKTFDYTTLNLYRSLPDDLQGESYAIIDPNRKSGNDFFVLMIYKKQISTNLWFPISCILKQKSLTEESDLRNVFANEVLNTLQENNCIECTIESNVGSGTKKILEMISSDKGYRAIKFKEKYTTGLKGETKISRILAQEDTIKSNICFPAINLCNPYMHQAMKMFCDWDSKKGQVKSNPDDVPDVHHLFAKYYINPKNQKSSFIDFDNRFGGIFR